MLWLEGGLINANPQIIPPPQNSYMFFISKQLNLCSPEIYEEETPPPHTHTAKKYMLII